jgi:hypothetical protein
MTDLEAFAAKHSLPLAKDKNDLLGKWSRYILGRNGSVLESDTPGRLLATIAYLNGRERTEIEFRLAYQHVQLLTDRCSEGSLCAEFSADNEGQGNLIIELAQLRGGGYDPRERHDR